MLMYRKLTALRCHLLPAPPQAAFTLLEVILALAILAGAMAIIGEVMSVAERNASEAQATAQAQLLAGSLMDEMLSGASLLTASSQVPLETSDTVPWVYSVNINATTAAVDLIAVEVIVEQDMEPRFNPVKYRLVRWVSQSANPSLQQGLSGTGGGRG